MDKFSLIPSNGSIPFEAHLERLDPRVREMILELRSFTKGLGSNVIEEVRPHRIVYAKTLTFRIFLDIEPAGDRLIMEVRTGRGKQPVRFEVARQSNLEESKRLISQAYEKIC